MKKGVQTAICCPCGNEKILALGLCATCYTLKRQDAEYFGGLREQVLERDGKMVHALATLAADASREASRVARSRQISTAVLASRIFSRKESSL